MTGRCALLALALVAACATPPAEQEGVRVPAFVDHHVHVFNVGWWLRESQRTDPAYVAAGGATSEAEVVARAAAAAKAAPGGLVTGFGWSQDAWGTPMLPTSVALSAAVPDVPVAMARTDGHALWVNDAALKRAGLKTGGRGVLLERQTEPVLALVPAPSDDAIVEAWRLGAEALADRGVTRAYDAGVLALPGIAALNTDFGRYVRLLAAADDARPLPLQLFLMIPAPSPYAEEVLAMKPAARQLSPNVRITHLKLFADGALGSRGAALSHPYADDPHTTGVLRMYAPEIAEWSRRAIDAGIDVATHAIGDEAVHQVLDAYEAVLRARPDVEPTRLRIEHFSYASEVDMVRAVRLGVALSVQSNFNTPRGVSPTFAGQRVGVAGAPRVYAWDRLSQMGAVLVEGSDYFGEPGAPLLGMYYGLVGINAVGERGDSPEVRQELLRLNTAWLAPGGALQAPVDAAKAKAGFVLLSGDPLTVPAESLLTIRVPGPARQPR
ncbi:MAG: amidohydrolase family protein [Gemmatimonadota bacterium]|nr:amidohydrolase family protein [Gemmatimonadota bacterium]